VGARERGREIGRAGRARGLSDRRAAIEGIGLTFADGLALEAKLGRESVATGIGGAARFAGGEGRGAEGAGV
jgi:hypothetical protein